MKKTICITGGHLSPAFAVASYLHKHHPEIRILFIGRQMSFTSKEFQTKSAEEEVMRPVSDSVFLLPLERFGFSFGRLISIIQSLLITGKTLLKEKPSAIVSFGGYVGLYVSIVGFLVRIPIVIHEQTHTIGKANKFLARIARICCVSYEDMKSDRWKYTGFPIREEIITPPATLSFPVLTGKKLLYITGGTTGAVPLNEMCFPRIEEWSKSFMIVHQTGNLSFTKAEKLKNNLPEDQRNSYYVTPYIPPSDASWLIHHADCVISRSGANTVYELAITKIPSVLVPLSLGNSEQVENAHWLTTYAPSTIVSQQQISSDQLVTAVKTMTSDPPASFPEVPTNGTQLLVEQIISLL